MPSTAQLLAFTDVSTRAETIVFDVLNANGVRTGSVTPAPPEATITLDTTRRNMRSLDSLRLTPSDTAAIDPLSDLIRPSWRFVGDTLFPLGVFTFANPQRLRHSWGLESVNNLIDLTVKVDVPSSKAVGVASGVRVVDAITAYAAQLGIVLLSVGPSDVVVGQPMAWPPGTSSYQVFADLAALASFFPPYFDNTAVFTFRAMPPNIMLAVPRFTYEYGGLVEADTITESDDLLTAPNRYIVIGGGTLNAAPIVGTFDIPASAPNSIPNRGGIVVPKVLTVQAVQTQEQADDIARSEYAKERLGTQAEFDSVVQPEHDTFDVVRYNGANYLEVGWRLPLTAGASQHHTLRSVLG